MSSSRYSDIFRQRFGYSPIDWFTRQRVQQACHLLDVTREKVEVVGLEVGFRDPYYFSRSFRKVMGSSPREYRAQSMADVDPSFAEDPGRCRRSPCYG